MNLNWKDLTYLTIVFTIFSYFLWPVFLDPPAHNPGWIVALLTGASVAALLKIAD